MNAIPACKHTHDRLRRHAFVFVIILNVILMLPVVIEEKQADASLAVNAQQVSLSGSFHVIWTDDYRESHVESVRYVLIDDTGRWNPVLVDESLAGPPGGWPAFDRQRVTITGQRISRPSNSLHARTIQFEQPDNIERRLQATTSAVTGAKPWLTILCRFADYSSVTPHPKSWFETLMGASYPGMDHYWRELSYNAINLTGSQVVGWYNLPRPLSFYVPSGHINMERLAEDCTAAADNDIFFPKFAGINLMFNTDYIDAHVYGGSTRLTRDGQTKYYGMTWMKTSVPGCWPDWNACPTPATYSGPKNLHSQ